MTRDVGGVVVLELQDARYPAFSLLLSFFVTNPTLHENARLGFFLFRVLTTVSFFFRPPRSAQRLLVPEMFHVSFFFK